MKIRPSTVPTQKSLYSHEASLKSRTLSNEMTTSSRFLVINGVVSPPSEVPPVSSFLETHPGAYTTSRTHNNASCILFWERHILRLTQSAQILAESKPDFLFGSQQARVSRVSSSSSMEHFIRDRLKNSLQTLLPIALKERTSMEELAITTLVTGNLNKLQEHQELNSIFGFLNVCVHIGMYVPPVFRSRENAAHLALVGRGRDVANAKFSEWVRIRKFLENLRPPGATELLLSNDGDRILEGCITNFFVICCNENTNSLEIQTTPLCDGVLPGVIRQIVLEVSLNLGLPVQEVAPSWSKRELWVEAFITNSLRLVQHVETIRVPSSWESLETKTWKDVTWEEKRFEKGPGTITAEVQRELMKRADFEGYASSAFT